MSHQASILALAAIIGLTAGCDEDPGNPGDVDAPGGGGKADELTTGADPEPPPDDEDAATGSETGEPEGDAQADCPDAAEVFPATWPEGGPACPEPVLTVHRYDRDTFILRQSLCTSFEAPFLYMLFGEDAVLVEDTGAGGIPVGDAIEQVVAFWEEDTQRATDEPLDIIVVNSHAHGDHVAGNAQLAVRPGFRVVGFGVDAVSTFLDIDWPHESGEIDLGGRVVEVIPIPGHESSHVALWDHGARLLLTGDTLYPGRVFVDEFVDLRDSISKLVEHVADDPPCFVLGTHIEMTREPGVDFEFGTTHHPNEHALQLSFEHLRELDDALQSMGDAAVFERHDDFIVFPL